jgi:hypothetical protein
MQGQTLTNTTVIGKAPPITKNKYLEMHGQSLVRMLSYIHGECIKMGLSSDASNIEMTMKNINDLISKQS